MKSLAKNDDCVLVVIDIQNDFCYGGALAVPNGDQILPFVNVLINEFNNVVLTQDWHPPGHASFASTHGKNPYETVELGYGTQILWPDHCVQNTHGADFHPELNHQVGEVIIRKGFRPNIDSYSAFKENDQRTPTGLAGYIRERGFNHVVLCGLAYDFCVKWSALDARNEGFETTVIQNACCSINVEGAEQKAHLEMGAAGVKFL